MYIYLSIYLISIYLSIIDIYMCVSVCVCIHTSLYPLLQRRWTDGDTSPKALVISIHDDNTFEPTEADDKPTEAESEALLEWWPTEAKKK